MVQEKNGMLRGTVVWKFPTRGMFIWLVLHHNTMCAIIKLFHLQGADICDVAAREEMGVSSKCSIFLLLKLINSMYEYTCIQHLFWCSLNFAATDRDKICRNTGIQV